jgi:hypothetical protein
MGGYFGGHVDGRAGAFVGRGRLVGMLRGAPGPFVAPFHRGFALGGFDDGFRPRFRGGLDWPLLGPVGIGFPHRPRGFFGFPRNHFGFAFFDGFAFSSGFPFVDGFVFFNGFPFIDGFGFPLIDGFAFFDGFPDGRFFRGFPRRRFGFFSFPHQFGFFGQQGVPVGVPLGFIPSFGAAGGYMLRYTGGPYAADTLAARHMQRVSDTRPALGRQLVVPGTGSAAGDSLVVERVSVMDVVPAAALRLTWRNVGLEAEQVTLFLADTAQGVLAAQALRAAPFTALFEPLPGTAFAGMTVVWPDGTTSTRVVPYRVRPH